MVEPLNKLLTGVRYGGSYMNMAADWGQATPPANASDYKSILAKDKAHNTGHMKIAAAKDNVTNTFTVTVWGNGVVTYTESGIALTVGVPRLQTHWGSGVLFNNVKFT